MVIVWAIVNYGKAFSLFLYNEIYLKYLMVYTPPLAIALRNFVISVIGFEVTWFVIAFFFGFVGSIQYRDFAGFSLHPVNQFIFSIQALYLGLKYRYLQHYEFIHGIGEFFVGIWNNIYSLF